jgi:hypothetical protein
MPRVPLNAPGWPTRKEVRTATDQTCNGFLFIYLSVFIVINFFCGEDDKLDGAEDNRDGIEADNES